MKKRRTIRQGTSFSEAATKDAQNENTLTITEYRKRLKQLVHQS